MKIRFKGLLNILKREVRLIAKDINIISVILLAPLFYSFFYGAVYINKVETDIPIVIIDWDHSPTSQKLIRYFDSHQSLNITRNATHLSEAQEMMNKGEIQGIILIPDKFESQLKKNQDGVIKMYLNTSRFLVSNDINKAVNEVVGYFNAGIAVKFFESKGLNYNQALNVIEPVRTDMRSLFNFTESYGDFLIPGILVLIIQQTLLIGLSESFAKEREENTIPGLFKQSNGSIFALIHGKSLFYFILYSAYSLMFFTINFYVFKIPFHGNTAALIILTFLLILSVIYYSLLISSFFKRKIIAIQFLTLTSYPIFLMSGFSWPINTMPLFIRYLAYLIPSTPYLSAYVRITQMGAEIGHVMPELQHMAALTILGLLLLIIRLKYICKKETECVYELNSTVQKHI